jgi:putative transposase
VSSTIKRLPRASELVYRYVFPVKYSQKIFNDANEPTLKVLALELEKRYELNFLEIGIDTDHVHFLIQAIPSYAPSYIVNTVKGNITKQFFLAHPEIKIFLWGGHLWSDGYYVNTVGNASMSIIKNYVQQQGIPECKQLHHQTATLF